MSISRRPITVAAVVTVVLAATLATPGAAMWSTREEPDGSAAGTRTLGVSVTDPDGEPADNVGVVIKNAKTGSNVYSGTTDNAGQISVTLPQGDYDVIVQNTQKRVKLNKDSTVSFALKSDELPKAA